MNTPENWTTTASVTNPERRQFWLDVFGVDRVPIKSILPQRVALPGFEAGTDAYMLDLPAISPEQRKRLIAAIAQKFNIPVDEVEAELDQGVPILASDVLVSSSDPVFFSMIDGLEVDDGEE
jgi:hypothetical protein